MGPVWACRSRGETGVSPTCVSLQSRHAQSSCCLLRCYLQSMDNRAPVPETVTAGKLLHAWLLRWSGRQHRALLPVPSSAHSWSEILETVGRHWHRHIYVDRPSDQRRGHSSMRRHFGLCNIHGRQPFLPSRRHDASDCHRNDGTVLQAGSQRPPMQSAGSGQQMGNAA